MKILLATSAFAAALVAVPAFAQPPVEASHDIQIAASESQPPKPTTSVTVDTDVVTTPTAVIETKTEVITPVDTRPALDPDHPIAPEVKAVVAAKKRYTTQDIVLAQNEAVKNTPVSEPTTVIVTKTTTPTPG